MINQTLTPGTTPVLISSLISVPGPVCERLLLQPLAGNTGDTYISSSQTAAGGFLLAKGSLINLPITGTKIYLRCTNAADIVEVGVI